MSTITAVTTITASAVYRPESTLTSLLDVLEKYESSNDPASIQLAQRGIAIFNAEEDAEAAKQVVLLQAELQNQNSPFAQELQAWVDGLPPEAIARVDPIAVMSQLLLEQTEIRVNHQRRMQTVFHTFTENLRVAKEEAQQQAAQLVQETATRIDEQNVIHARDLESIQATHRGAMNLADIRLNDTNTRLENTQNLLSQTQQQTQQACADLRAQIDAVHSQTGQLQQQLAQKPKKKHGISIKVRL